MAVGVTAVDRFQEGYAVTRTAILAAIAGTIALTGCTDSPEPAAPPTSQGALTTATTEPAEDDAATSEAAATTEAPEADGPPQMPAQANEQTEEGAEAFALYYVNLINYTGTDPELGLLEPLAAESCTSCANHEESVAYAVENGQYLALEPLKIDKPTSIFTGDTSRVSIPVEQVAQAYLGEDGNPTDRDLPGEVATLVVRVLWEDGWLVSEITVGP